MRIGSGVDVHAFSKTPPVILGGVELDHEIGLLGHSDADVLTHAIMDAILGALSLGDIGEHFPPQKEEYRDAYSINLLKRCQDMAHDEGYKILNIDSTVMAERPRIGPYTGEIKRTIAKALNLEVSEVSVKATTFEGLGFVGRNEGIMAQAVVLMNNIS